jgi:hypothetical protein
MTTIRLLSPALAALLCASCAPGPSATPADTAGPRAGTAPADAAASRERVERLEREARALARADGCEQDGQCRTAPVGSRPCGGPRDYVAYCALTTDSAALYAKLAELAAAEKAFNEKEGLASTCEFRMPPAVSLAGGQCAAAGGDNRRAAP